MKSFNLCLLFSFICTLFFVTSVSGHIRLPSVISSNMVLQQKNHVMLWGWANPSEKITIATSWDNASNSAVTNENGDWKMIVKTPAAGGPYTITLKGQSTIVLNDILIGEVWVCSGQSNMEQSGNQQLKQIIDELPNCNNNYIRFFNVKKSTAEYPKNNLQGEWKTCSSESLKGFSAVGYFFGKKLQQSMNIPIGLINASWGGTPAETWTPTEAIDKNSKLSKAAAKINLAKWPTKPGMAYNAMISPLVNFSIAGVAWYQGESNATSASTYSELFITMINSWRKAWRKEFPFYYVQIAPYQSAYKNVNILLREQQTLASSYSKTRMVVITDLVDDVREPHPQNKMDVGIRLANFALAETYKQQIANYKSPFFKRMRVKKDKAVLFFKNAPQGFITKNGKMATEFLIAGEDKVFFPAEVKLEKNKIIVFNKDVIKPGAVRFAFSNTAISNLFSKDGLPVCPFRTDDWEIDTGKD